MESWVEGVEQRLLAKEAVDETKWFAALNTMMGLLNKLGMARRARPVKSLTEYLQGKHQDGGSQDAMTLAVAQREGDQVVLDLVREVRAPFSPEQVVADFVRTLKPYRLMQMTGDRFGDEWCRQPFRKAGSCISWPTAPAPTCTKNCCSS